MSQVDGVTTYSVVVPAYNEAENLPELLDRLAGVMEPLGPYEVIVVDDGSRDGTWPVLRRASEQDPRIVAIRLLRNFGQHAAVSAGFARCGGDIVITLDADLQNPPEEIPRLLDALGPDCDVAGGWRQGRSEGALRAAPSRLMTAMIGRLTGVRLHDYGCMLRAHKRFVIDEINALPEKSRCVTPLVSWLGAQVREVPVAHEPRRSGASRYSFWRLVRLALDILTGFGAHTMQLVTVAGALVAVAGLLAVAAAAATAAAGGRDVFGSATLAALLVLFGGLQLATTGLVGEYVTRAYAQVQGRPLYIVRERSGAGLPSAVDVLRRERA